MTKAIDIVKPQPKTSIEVFERWLNRMQGQFLTAPYVPKKTIEVKDETEAEAIARRTKDWPTHDPDPNHCSGLGHETCTRQGVHSWFNHAADKEY